MSTCRLETKGRRRTTRRVPRSSNDSLNIDSDPVPTMDSARENMARLLRQEGFFDS